MRLLEPATSRKEVWLQLGWFGLWVVATGVLWWLRPDASGHGTHQQLGFPPCPTVLLFDRPCPGCGLTTSWSAIVNGSWSLAWRSHPFGLPTYIVFTLSAWLCGYGYVRTMRFRTESALVNWGALAIGASFLAFGLVRASTTSNYANTFERLFSIDQVARE